MRTRTQVLLPRKEGVPCPFGLLGLQASRISTYDRTALTFLPLDLFLSLGVTTATPDAPADDDDHDDDDDCGTVHCSARSPAKRVGRPHRSVFCPSIQQQSRGVPRFLPEGQQQQQQHQQQRRTAPGVNMLHNKPTDEVLLPIQCG
jgi:hypothetical protein